MANGSRIWMPGEPSSDPVRGAYREAFDYQVENMRQAQQRWLDELLELVELLSERSGAEPTERGP